MTKKLKKWNGRCRLSGSQKQGSAMIAAYSQKQAAELLAQATGYSRGITHEIRVYFSQCWGSCMDGIEPMEPCLYYKEGYGKEVPIRII